MCCACICLLQGKSHTTSYAHVYHHRVCTHLIGGGGVYVEPESLTLTSANTAHSLFTNTEKIKYVCLASVCCRGEGGGGEGFSFHPPSTCTSSSSFMMALCVCSTSKSRLIHQDSSAFLVSVIFKQENHTDEKRTMA